jgi:hypothetical protein
MPDIPEGRIPINVDVATSIKIRFDEARGQHTQRELISTLIKLWSTGELKHPSLPEPRDEKK